MQKIKVLSVFGTRPEAIKMAPLVLELQKCPEIESLVCVTAQHREMLDSVMDCFGLRADFDLNLMRQGQTLTDITARVLEGLGAILTQARPDLVLVHGDTTTAFSSALTAFYAKVPVGHVEAGLRTFDKASPYPEEMNRQLIGRIANLHFAPTGNNVKNLNREGIFDGIYITGNTVIDAMKYTVTGSGFTSPELSALPLEGKRVIAMTCHRRENYGAPMEQIFAAVRQIAGEFPDVQVIYPVHPAPVVRKTANRILGGVANISLIEPLDAIDMHRLMSKSYLVMTDSGGIQEEAPSLGKPVLVLRQETERPEAVAAGTVMLAGVETEHIVGLARRLLTDQSAYHEMAQAVNPYGDGMACRRIVDAILYHFGRRAFPPEAFSV